MWEEWFKKKPLMYNMNWKTNTSWITLWPQNVHDFIQFLHIFSPSAKPSFKRSIEIWPLEAITCAYYFIIIQFHSSRSKYCIQTQEHSYDAQNEFQHNLKCKLTALLATPDHWRDLLARLWCCCSPKTCRGYR